MLRRNHETVGEDVVNIIGGQRARISQVIDLDGRRTIRQDAGATVIGESFQVDGDVGLPLAQHLGDVAIALTTNVDKVVECVLKPPPHVTVSVGPERYGHRLEALSVVLFKQTCGQVRGGMIVEIS